MKDMSTFETTNMTSYKYNKKINIHEKIIEKYP